MSPIMLMAFWVMNAPAGYVIGQLALDHFEPDTETAYTPWFCAVFPPLAAVLALMLIFKEETK